MRLPDWHDRYALQAGWTKNLRNYFLNKLGVQPGNTLLEVGSGTGALIQDFRNIRAIPFALDIDYHRMAFARTKVSNLPGVCADGVNIPVSNHMFNFSVCHYLLLWAADPLAILKEMVRVTRKGGAVIAFAEPDYASRIDYPEIFSQIGDLQNRSINFQGIDLQMGRKLGHLFRESGLVEVKLGLLAGEWRKPSEEVFDAEWNIIAWDLGGFVPIEEIISLKEKAKASWLSGEATVFIPTFYAYGIIK
jgi:SAM-dependent methyltransferase